LPAANTILRRADAFESGRTCAEDLSVIWLAPSKRRVCRAGLS
jgi:hypothetical protein